MAISIALPRGHGCSFWVCVSSQILINGLAGRNSWKLAFMSHPHLRFDGVYVARNTYIRTGAVELSSRRPVHVVVYFRYYRFLPDGSLLYRTSPLPIAKVARSLATLSPSQQAVEDTQAMPCKPASPDVFCGRYVLKEDKVWAVIRYPNCRSTEIRSRLHLRSTSPGANNRLDILSIVSFDHELGRAAPLDGSASSSSQPSTEQQQPGEQDLDPERAPHAHGREHKRGTNTCCFVPWDQ
ncbi:hypothetical protein QJQ45_029282, partial [Haematococcus lacustris]